MTKKNNLIFLIIIFLYSIYCALQLGYTWDVLFHYELGKDRLDYLLSFGTNEINDKIQVRKFYTGAYSTISAFFVQFFPRAYVLEAIYLVNLSFSVLTIFGIQRVTKELFNKKIGQITFLLCFFNPIFFGHMAMNSTDTIVAFANIWCVYIILRYFKFQNDKNKKNKYIIYLGLLLGLGLGVRYSFFVTLLPIFIFIILELFYFKLFINKKFSRNIFLIDFIKVLFIAYLFMVLFWPQTHQNIFLLPIKLALEGFSFGFGTPFILFNGEIFLTSEIPKNYILINLFYKMPEFFILSFILFIFLFITIGSHFKKEFKGFYFKIFFVLFIILFPNILLLITPYEVYDGLRLFLFLLPFICIIPSILIFFLYKKIKNNLYKFIFLFLIFLKIFYIFNFFSLTPYHYVYLNIFAGKYSENSKKFENDYWGVSTKKLISEIKNHNKIFKNSKVKIAVCGLPEDVQSYYLKKIKNLKFEIVSKEENFDYMIMNNRVIWDRKNNSYDPKKATTCFEKFSGEDLITVERRGLIISKIIKSL